MFLCECKGENKILIKMWFNSQISFALPFFYWLYMYMFLIFCNKIVHRDCAVANKVENIFASAVLSCPWEHHGAWMELSTLLADQSCKL